MSKQAKEKKNSFIIILRRALIDFTSSLSADTLNNSYQSEHIFVCKQPKK